MTILGEVSKNVLEPSIYSSPQNRLVYPQRICESFFATKIDAHSQEAALNDDRLYACRNAAYFVESVRSSMKCNAVFPHIHFCFIISFIRSPACWCACPSNCDDSATHTACIAIKASQVSNVLWTLKAPEWQNACPYSRRQETCFQRAKLCHRQLNSVALGYFCIYSGFAWLCSVFASYAFCAIVEAPY